MIKTVLSTIVILGLLGVWIKLFWMWLQLCCKVYLQDGLIYSLIPLLGGILLFRAISPLVSFPFIMLIGLLK